MIIRGCCWNVELESAIHHRSYWRHTCWWRIQPPMKWYHGTMKGRHSSCGSRQSLLVISSQLSSSTATSLALSGNSIPMYVHVQINTLYIYSIYIYIWFSPSFRNSSRISFIIKWFEWSFWMLELILLLPLFSFTLVKYSIYNQSY